MSILTSALPSFVCIDGEKFEINTDFKVYLSLESIIFDNSVSVYRRTAKILALCYKKLPSSLDGALEALMEFYAGGSDMQKKYDDGRKDNGRVLSFEEDAPYILSSFLTEYGINLLTAHLHWWEFLALLKGLRPSCRLCEVIKYRTVDLSKIKNREQRKFYARQKRLYALKRFEGDDEIAENLLKIF